MRRRRRRKRNNNTQKFVTIALFLTVGGVLTAVGWNLYREESAAKINSKGGYDHFDTSRVTIVDCSPPRFGEKQTRTLRKELKDIWKHKLEFNDLWTFVSTQKSKLADTLISEFQYHRVAKTPSDYDKIPVPRRSAAYIRKMEKEVFGEIEPVIDRVLDDAENAPGESPILETLKIISKDPCFNPDLGFRYLDFASDLFQQSKLVNFGDGIPTWEDFVQTDAYSKIAPASLEGVHVRIFILLRSDPNFDENKLVAFFTGYFTHFGAEIDDVVRLTVDVVEVNKVKAPVKKSYYATVSKNRTASKRAVIPKNEPARKKRWFWNKKPKHSCESCGK